MSVTFPVPFYLEGKNSSTFLLQPEKSFFAQLLELAREGLVRRVVLSGYISQMGCYCASFETRQGILG